MILLPGKYLTAIILFKEGKEAIASYTALEKAVDQENKCACNLTRQELIQLVRYTEPGITIDLLDPARLAKFIKNDPPVIIASLLYCLPGYYAQSVMQYCMEDLQKNIASCSRGKINFELAEWLKIKLQNLITGGEPGSNEH